MTQSQQRCSGQILHISTGGDQPSQGRNGFVQVTEGDVELAQLLLESLQQLLQQQQQRHSTSAPSTTADILGSDLAANKPLVPASPDLETPEVYTIWADMAKRTQNENLQVHRSKVDALPAANTTVMSCDSKALHRNALATNLSQQVRLSIFFTPSRVASNTCLLMPSFGAPIIRITHMLLIFPTRQTA